MVREILFRGKRLHNGEWVEGNFYESGISGAYILQNVTRKTVDARTGELTMWDEPAHFEIDPSTVGQFTGLTDKNGKRIFEGDIVQAHFRTNHSKQIFRVTFDDGMFIFNNGHVKLPVRGIYGIKVIGNIHDNPELLEDEDD